MNASGNTITLVYDTASYYFDTMTLTAVCRIEDTPLIDGGHYRVRTAVNTNTLRLKGRVPFSVMSGYKALMDAFGSGRRSFTLNGAGFTGWSLLSGKLSSAEGDNFAVCELILTEVSE